MKTIFILINCILLATIAFFCIEIAYKTLLPRGYSSIENILIKTQSNDAEKDVTHNSSRKNLYNKIVARNLFKVDIEEQKDGIMVPEKIVNAIEALEPTTLNLSLRGTVTGVGQEYAVIEDKTQKQQSLYGIGDIIQDATLKKILRDKVIFNFQGKDQVLEMEIAPSKKAISKKSGEKPSKTMALNTNRPDADKEGFEEIPDHIKLLNKQIKTRLHFAKGVPDGIMVYGIRPDSVFKKAGLKNGDIIKEINGKSIEADKDSSRLYDEILRAENARISLLRRGKYQELIYDSESGVFSTEENAESADTEENAESADTEENAESADTEENAEPADTEENAEPADTEENAEPADTEG